MKTGFHVFVRIMWGSGQGERGTVLRVTRQPQEVGENQALIQVRNCPRRGESPEENLSAIQAETLGKRLRVKQLIPAKRSALREDRYCELQWDADNDGISFYPNLTG